MLINEIRHAVRTLAKNPGFSVAAVVTLALGIGANSAVFSIVDAFLLRAPEVHAPEELVRIYTSTPEGMPFGGTSFPDYRDIVQASELFTGVAAYTPTVAALAVDGDSEAVLGELVSGNYFSVLGVEPVTGRAFLNEEDRTPGTHPVVVLGHGFWQRRLGGDLSVVGQEIRLNGRSFTVVGVAPESFGGLLPGISSDLWAPTMMAGALQPDQADILTNRASRQFFLHARMRQTATVDQAEAAIGLLARRLEQAYPASNAGHSMTVIPASSVRFHPRVDFALASVGGLLLAIVGMVLLIACTNLAGLLLARTSDRRREIAVRMALGARRRQIVRHLLVESALLALCGGATGLLVASWLANLLVNFRTPLPIPINVAVHIDGRVLAFTALLSLLTSVLFGLAPALRASRPDLVAALKDETSGLRWRARRLGLRNLLLAGQVAVSTVLLIVAGLFVRSLQSARAVEPGFDTDRTAIFTINAGARFGQAEGEEFYRQLLERAGSLPGTESVALADRLPLDLSFQSTELSVEDRSARARPGGGRNAGAEETFQVDFARVSPGYFRTLGVSLVAGRDFATYDDGAGPRVAIVNETAARLFWPGEEVLGKRLRRGGTELEVVGLAADTKVRGLGDEARPYLYVPFGQSYESAMHLVIRTVGDPRDSLAAGRELIRSLDPDLAPLVVKTMPDHLAVALFPVRMAAGFVGAFGLLALLLASVGVSGLMATTVARRTHEIGVRMALGARPDRLMWLVMGGAMKVVGVGIAIGVLAALGTTQLLGSFLVGISPTDPMAFAGIALLLMSVALAASYLPARRATSCDLAVLLRSE